MGYLVYALLTTFGNYTDHEALGTRMDHYVSVYLFAVSFHFYVRITLHKFIVLFCSLM